jgi:hypothetical protein
MILCAYASPIPGNLINSALVAEFKSSGRESLFFGTRELFELV